MKYTRIILLAIGLMIVPLLSFASIPEYPMAFWGNIKINDKDAKIGTIVRAYYGSTLAGEIEVKEGGVYGYTDSTKQKLLVASGDGKITFKIQQADFNNGKETTGDNLQIYSSFISGETVELNLSFKKKISISGGGGGGGGSSSGNSETIINTPTLVSPSINDNGCLSGYLYSSTTGLKCNNLNATEVDNSNTQLNVSNLNINRTLKYGMQGDDVKQLQIYLNNHGYTISLTGVGSKGYETNFFGNLTKQAVIKFQKSNNLIADGIVGPATKNFIK